MELKIDLNQIKNDFTNAFGKLKSTVGEWTGRLVTVLKAGSEKATVHLQDKRIAVVSLVALNLILLEIGIKLSNYVPELFEDDWKNEAVAISCGLSPMIIGTAAFTKYAKLPLHPLVVAGISGAVLFGRCQLDALFLKTK